MSAENVTEDVPTENQPDETPAEATDSAPAETVETVETTEAPTEPTVNSEDQNTAVDEKVDNTELQEKSAEPAAESERKDPEGAQETNAADTEESKAEEIKEEQTEQPADASEKEEPKVEETTDGAAEKPSSEEKPSEGEKTTIEEPVKKPSTSVKVPDTPEKSLEEPNATTSKNKDQAAELEIQTVADDMPIPQNDILNEAEATLPVIMVNTHVASFESSPFQEEVPEDISTIEGPVSTPSLDSPMKGIEPISFNEDGMSYIAVQPVTNANTSIGQFESQDFFEDKHEMIQQQELKHNSVVMVDDIRNQNTKASFSPIENSDKINNTVDITINKNNNTSAPTTEQPISVHDLSNNTINTLDQTTNKNMNASASTIEVQDLIQDLSNNSTEIMNNVITDAEFIVTKKSIEEKNAKNVNVEKPDQMNVDKIHSDDESMIIEDLDDVSYQDNNKANSVIYGGAVCDPNDSKVHHTSVSETTHVKDGFIESESTGSFDTSISTQKGEKTEKKSKSCEIL